MMQSNGPKYFESPEEAVRIISELLTKEDYITLSRYYYLKGYDIEIKELETGDFFIRRERPEIAHPGGFWRYKHPFAPGFKYDHHIDGPDETLIVSIRIEIDEGDGMVREGRDAFKMKKTPHGLQILPENIDIESQRELII